MRKPAVALALAAAALSAAAQTPAPPAAAGTDRKPAALPTPPAASPTPSGSASLPQPNKEGTARGTVLEEVSGKVASIDRKAHLLKVETASGQVTLSLDRNTMVYTSTGLGTALDVAPGAQIRAGRNAEYLAYWVQVRAQPAQPASTQGQGTGAAGGGSAAASESVGPGAGAAPAAPTAGPSSTGPGSVGPAP